MRDLANHYRTVRTFTESLCETLEVEDQVVQSMPDVSPTKWHLAHTTWFFETFVLSQYADHEPSDPAFQVLFNSYYNAVGEQFPRPRRGLLTRPTLDQVNEYRAAIDGVMDGALDNPAFVQRMRDVVTIGLHHEQQHQELILTDILHVLSCNPLRPAYRSVWERPAEPAPGDIEWLQFTGGVRKVGFAGEGFSFDNEGPSHRVFLRDFCLANRPVTNGEYLQFMADGGYEKPELWLSLGWDVVQRDGWSAPLYWEGQGADWRRFTLGGMQPVCPAQPVCHLSYFEADAFARWAGARLPTEAEWEVAAADATREGNLAEDRGLWPKPIGVTEDGPLVRMIGDVWEWTQSQYQPYPGYRPPPGALGEYNGKFMCNQFVLRGGSLATPRTHIRPTYRNFFPPEARWQFTGLRLAKDA